MKVETRPAEAAAASDNVLRVPLTLEGASVLHQMFRVRWPAWKALSETRRQEIVDQAVPALLAMETPAEGQSALFSLLGHKGDLMLVHFRPTFDELNAAELSLAHLDLADYLEPTTSYLSVVELGLYESTVRLHASLTEKGVQPGSPEWEQETEAALAQQRKAMKPRLWPEIPARRYLCFYPMDKKRGEAKNWYEVPIRERQRLMHEHGMIGRKYAGQVKQIISGSIGFDDWEWGVDLFADDPLVYKRLIYEMRFDEASAVYALFGTFYIGLRFRAEDLGTLLAGKTPAFSPRVE
ncbi:MAG: hydrogen peroxide-dependent heme synthase [Bryobacteraceae bacterium]